ncbi:MAG: hypothetical protein C5S48_08920 [Candidatus Methanogaster sp.]|nr:MAG: hypothetical protein C5S48_08920 [ANME-2 cluster archaeon]
MLRMDCFNERICAMYIWIPNSEVHAKYCGYVKIR